MQHHLVVMKLSPRQASHEYYFSFAVLTAPSIHQPFSYPFSQHLGHTLGVREVYLRLMRCLGLVGQAGNDCWATAG